MATKAQRKEALIAKWDANPTIGDVKAAKAILDALEPIKVKSVTLNPIPFLGGNYGYTGVFTAEIGGETVTFQATQKHPASDAGDDAVSAGIHRLAVARKASIRSERETMTLADKLSKLSAAEKAAMIAQLQASISGKDEDEDEDEDEDDE